MKAALIAMLVTIFMLNCGSAPASANQNSRQDIEITDDFGHTVKLGKPAQRIVPLYGAFGEILLALGCGDRIVARTNADASIPGLSGLPSIGTHMRPNAELIIKENPDVILQSSGRAETSAQTEALRKLGLNVLVFEMDSFAQLFSALKKIGHMTGKEAEAARLLENWQDRLNAMKARHDGRKPKKVFYEIRYPNLLAAGQKGIVNDIIKAAGGENVVAIPKKIAKINEEILLVADPDAYLLQKGPMNPNPEPPVQRESYKPLRAIREGKIMAVPEKIYARPGPNSILAAEELEKWLFSDNPPRQ